MEKALTRVGHVGTVSEFTKKELITYFSYPEERIETIKNGFSSNITEEKSKDEKIGCFLKEKKVPQDYLLYTGVLDPRKNFSRLIEAIQICRKSLGDFPDLVVTGVSFEDWIKSDQAKKAKKIGIINNIYIAGIVDKRILKELTRKALALCYPSLYEGFGFPPLEAMSVGIPVLASNSSSIPEVTGDAACLVNPMSVEDISQGLERIIFDNEYRQKLVKRGSKQLKKYSWRKTSAEYIRLYKEVLDR
jgi:alpha-1,3-rhamnosyl/mannosyltransferase